MTNFRPLNTILDFFYPPTCLVCGKAGAIVHSTCRSSLDYLSEPFCAVCGYPLSHPQQDCPSLLCKLSPENRYLDEVRSVFRHNGGAQKAIWNLKYKGVTNIKQWLGNEMEKAARYYSFNQAAAIVAVPLHPKRLKERGYNQAGVIAEGLAQRLNLPLGEGWLIRSRYTPSQVGLNATERAVNVSGAFEWDTSPLKKQTILLIDDVCTTGATLNACAKVIKNAGGGQILALTTTRVVNSIIRNDDGG